MSGGGPAGTGGAGVRIRQHADKFPINLLPAAQKRWSRYKQMELFNSALGRNITFVRPPYFILRGFIGLPHVNYYYFFLFFIYVVSLFGNITVLLVIILDHNLRSPKYVGVSNLMLVDLISNSALVPKLLEVFLLKEGYISYNSCLAFLFFCFLSLSMQALNLLVLAYDRLIAITFPLHYPLMVTNRFMVSLVAALWCFAVILILIAVGLLTRLSFCDSVVVNSFFCDHGPLFKLGCNDITPSVIIAAFAANLLLWLPLVFILTSYCCIFYALFKISTPSERVKAFKTCTAHLSLVALFFLPIITVYRLQESLDANVRILNLSLNYVIPPTLNPFIYALQTQEIKTSLKKLLRIRVQTKIVIKP